MKSCIMLLTGNYWNYTELFVVCTPFGKDKGRLMLISGIEVWFISVLNLLKNILRSSQVVYTWVFSVEELNIL